MTKILTLPGTRPDIIRLSRVIAVLDETFEHLLVHTCQNFDDRLSGMFFRDLGPAVSTQALRSRAGACPVSRRVLRSGGGRSPVARREWSE